MVLRQLRTSGERLLLLGHCSKWESVVIPEDVADVVVVLESLPFSVSCKWAGSGGSRVVRPSVIVLALHEVASAVA